MTVNEAIERAGSGFILEGLTNSSRVVGFCVLNQAGDFVATFNCVGLELVPLPVSSDRLVIDCCVRPMGTSPEAS